MNAELGMHRAFEKHLTEEKKASANTLSLYLRDIRQFGEYLDSHSRTPLQRPRAKTFRAILRC